MKCYHSTTKDRVSSIMENGLQPNSKPTWFVTVTPYVMLSLGPLPSLNGDDTVVLEVTDPRIKAEYFDDPEGLRWPYVIKPEFIREFSDEPEFKHPYTSTDKSGHTTTSEAFVGPMIDALKEKSDDST